MVLRLSAALDVPLRQVNAMLRAAGHPPWYVEPEPDEALPTQVQATLDLMKRHHEPYPLIVMDRTYRMLDLNMGALSVLGHALPDLKLSDNLNIARLTLDPLAGGQVIANYPVVARDLLWRLQREVLAEPGNDALRDLLDELLSLPGIEPDWRRPDPTAPSAPTLEVQLRVGAEIWSFLIVVSSLLAPLDVALEELRVEQWFPADEATAQGCVALSA